MGWLRVLAGPIIGALLGTAARAIGIELTDEQVKAGGDVIATGIGLLTYGVTSKIVASKVNPGNAASPDMAQKFKREKTATFGH